MHYRSPTTAGLAPGTLKGKSLLAVWKADRRSPAFQGLWTLASKRVWAASFEV